MYIDVEEFISDLSCMLTSPLEPSQWNAEYRKIQFSFNDILQLLKNYNPRKSSYNENIKIYQKGYNDAKRNILSDIEKFINDLK